MGIRPERVAKELKRFISTVIHEELKDPRIGFVTVTDVEITKDLKSATVYYSAMGTQTDKNNTASALKSSIGYIKKLIGNNIDLRYMPEIIFKEDKAIEKTGDVYRILEKIKKEGENEHKKGKEDNRE